MHFQVLIAIFISTRFLRFSFLSVIICIGHRTSIVNISSVCFASEFTLNVTIATGLNASFHNIN